jgi:hypothetical protein
MTLTERRHLELKAKLADLTDDLGVWKARTADEPMRRHYSQVGRLSRTLDGLLESMTTSAGWKTPTDALVLERAAEWERRILTAHAIWQVFRSKLAQRLDPRFQMRLAACDDLAWACYKPAMDKFSTEKKEPPLLYLNSTWSAFLRKRDTTFEKDIDAGKDAREMLDEGDYRETLKRLPVPLLGLPWFQVGHMPSALMIAHEIGHAVEFDFGLTARIDQALVAANLFFPGDWRGAASEVFADLYGHLCLGHHFANCLLDLLVSGKEYVASEDAFAIYPTRAFRVELAVEALTFLKFETEAAAIRTAWETTYGELSQLQNRRPDVKKVVAAIYGDPGLNLVSLIQPPAYGAPETDPVPALAQLAVQQKQAEVAKHSDPRVLFCALRHAYDTYSTAQSERATNVLVKQIVEKNGKVFRFRGAVVDTKEKTDARVEALAGSDDVETGKALAQLLRLEN